jgi:hypothetical protein
MCVKEMCLKLQAGDSDQDGGSNSSENEFEDEECDAKNPTTVAVAVRGVKGDKREVKKQAAKRKATPPKPSGSSGAPAKKKVTKERATEKSMSKPTAPAPENNQEQKDEEGEKNEKNGGKKKAELRDWNTAKCDFDLFAESPTNILHRSCKITNNLILSCKMITQNEVKGLQSDFPALVFSRKTNGDKVFDFSVDLKLTDRLIQAMRYIIQENPTFFGKKSV